MLVLSRRETEELVISDAIRIRVLRIQGGTIAWGSRLPRRFRFRRAELARRQSRGLDGLVRHVSSQPARDRSD